MRTQSTKTRGALRFSSTLITAAVATALASCSTTAEPDPALDRAHTTYRALQSDPQAAQLAVVEMAQAEEALRTADTAWTQREEPETVDHLVYLAQQRVAIAREAVGTKTWEKAAAAAKSGTEAEKARAESDKARGDVAAARQSTQDKSVQLAVARAGAEQDKTRVNDLEMQLRDLNAKQTDRGNVITLADVLFDSNSAELRSGGIRDMAKLVDFFKLHPTRTALIEAFTDSQGSKAVNLHLSQRRAATVRDALVVHGVLADRLQIQGHGEAYPTSTNSTAAGRQMNRRVEIVLSRDDGTVKSR
ncbi:OmpA family protein [Aquabacterium sp. A7-Y]|uniref:OmpA family protein n=1 Tax=Aquabacterium sp. A7-Y TaxID=1349605 RepID=UPI00223DDF38|nr:OmpA family protein [Aquabacterium sp. A7-Y]MCW7541163.1 OmpA family protein [Aquabacterium sp. A7-Y]